ncbi:PREDICTED: lipopolysaccharide-binding protein [Chrysochloris asiatica]|uniref:Lipopolysaccharide-binding protein n=1 Tax=Chrysochloris asiatica TaxID=185453 RepID=A0A9B0X0K8_CHRAS|nr:PREDICTED: lipopolysaccharide-binding protein [Chrysochloris asiatica]
MGALAGALSSLLLGLLLTSTPRAHSATPGLVARITDKGLEYAAKEGLLALQSELHKITLPDFTGNFKIKHIGSGHYEFHRLNIHSCELHNSALRPLPGQGLSLTISDSFIRVQGKWKVRKSFLKLQGSFDLRFKGISISVNLLLGSEASGRPTVTTSSCNSQICDVDVDISGDLNWLLNLFHHQIESRFQRVLESKICEMVQQSVISDLQSYLQTMPVTTEIDSFASIDYSLLEAPQAAAQMLDVMFKGEIFNLNQRSPVAFLPPVMSLPEEHSKMVYFAISDYVFNTASLVYHQAGYLNFSVTDDLIPPDFHIRLTTKSVRPFIPRIARLYPNMNLELQGTVVSAPFLAFSPGNMSLTPQMEIKAFVLLPNSLRESVFRLGVATNVSAMLSFNTSKITGFLRPGKVQLELKESKFGVFNVELLEALINYYAVNNLYPKVNEKLVKGFTLPLLKRTQLYDLVLQIHKDFLFLGANVQYTRE